VGSTSGLEDGGTTSGDGSTFEAGDGE
jgi:hypothetical protein